MAVEKVCRYLDAETGQCRYLGSLSDPKKISDTALTLPVTELQPGQGGPPINSRDLHPRSTRRFICVISQNGMKQLFCPPNIGKPMIR